MARAFGMHAERVERAEDLKGAIERALANRPALLDVMISPEARSSDGKSGLAWVPDLQPLAAWDDAERIAASPALAIQPEVVYKSATLRIGGQRHL